KVVRWTAAPAKPARPLLVGAAESAVGRPRRQSRPGLFWSAPPSRRLDGRAGKAGPASSGRRRRVGALAEYRFDTPRREHVLAGGAGADQADLHAEFTLDELDVLARAFGQRFQILDPVEGLLPAR